jgi:hypothetical protein
LAAPDIVLTDEHAGGAARVMQGLWRLRHLQGKAHELESLITAGQSLVTKLEQQELFDQPVRDIPLARNDRLDLAILRENHFRFGQVEID